MQKKYHPDTLVVHAGQTPEPVTGAVMTPIFAVSTYAQESPGQHRGYEYSRTRNPTRTACEACMAELEQGQQGFAFASGMAAIATVLELLKPGDHVIAMDDLYGGSWRLFEKVRKQSAGLTFSFADLSHPDTIAPLIQPNTRMVWVETPTNPMLKLADLAAIAAICREHGLISVADNTFATPLLQRPLDHGFDIVVHSATKYLGGHSDVVSGVVVTGASAVLAERLAYLQNAVGAIAGPFDSFLVLRGLKTLALRMQRHCDNALALAHWLSSHPAVKRVIYPGLSSHPQHDLARRQMRAGGGMISLELSATAAETVRCLERFRLFTLAESLGGVESLVEYPALMTHASLPPAMREKTGISDSLIRLSVGIEHVEDLKADLAGALSSR